MKTIGSLLLLMLSLMQLSGQASKKLVILHTNDLHSRLTGYAPESEYTPLTVNDDNTRGGFARIAGIIKSERAINGSSVLVVDAGDFMMGTLFPSLERETGFQLRLMKEMGYDAAGLGNHEFDFGPGWIAAVIRKSSENGEIPVLLSSNSECSSKDSTDDSFGQLFRDNLISRKLIMEKNGIRIGLFSIIGKDADRVAPRAAPVTFEKQSKAAARMVKQLKDEKCDVIICLSHSGVTREKDGNWGGEDVELARKVKGISVIISGHTHTVLDQPLVVNGVPIVQTGSFGKNIGRLTVVCSNGNVSVEDYRLIPVDDRINGVESINGMIEEQKQKISEKILRPMGLTYTGSVAESGFTLEGFDAETYMNSNIGPLVADAIQEYVNSGNRFGTDMSMVAAGMIFDRILPGIQTAPDIFRVMPLGSGEDNIPGYPLARVYVTGKELKSILEILQVAYKKSPDNYCYYSGIRVEYDPDKGFLRKIKRIDILKGDGTSREVDLSKKNKTLYSVTADSYMLEFVGIIKKMSFGLINVAPKDMEGNRLKDMSAAIIDMEEKSEGLQEGKEWIALINYLKTMRDLNGNGIPDIDRKYSSPVRCFFPVTRK